MLLFQIRDFIKAHKTVSMAEITAQFNISYDQSWQFIEKLLDKGIIKRINTAELCCKNFKGCGNCVKLMFEIYEYNFE